MAGGPSGYSQGLGLSVERWGLPMADDQQSPVDALAEPYYEPIGPQPGGWLQPDEDDGGGRLSGPGIRAEVLAAAGDWFASARTLRFWAVTLGALCATWAAVAVLVMLPGAAGESTDWLTVPMLVYLLASSLLPATAALVAVHWGMSSYSRVAAAGRGPGHGILPAVLAAALQGLVFAALVLLTLLGQAAVADGPGSVAFVSAGVAALEGILFAGMGVGVAAFGRPAVVTRIAGWALAVLLVAGTVAAPSFLVPAVRTAEPVTVALNVEWAPDGTASAYECSGIPAGTREVYRTDRVMWLPAASPSVVFVSLAGQPGAAPELLGWLAAALQEAADGTQVPCVNGEPRSKDAPRTPVAGVGLLVQAAVAGAMLGGAYAAAARRRRLHPAS